MLVYGLFAAAVAILATVSIERLGGRLGGLLATIPTTIIPASLGILDRSPTEQDFVWAMAVVPMGMLVNSFFLWEWRVVPPRLQIHSVGLRLLAMVCISLTGWAVAAAMGLNLYRGLREAGMSPMSLGILTTVLLGFVGVVACLKGVPAPAGGRRVSASVLASRGILAGLCIIFSIWLSGLGMPLLSGIFSVFPAIFLTTMVALWLSQGEVVQAGAVGPMMLGSTSVAVYAMTAALVFPLWDSWMGALVSWGLSILVISIPAHLWLHARRETEHHETGNGSR